MVGYSGRSDIDVGQITWKMLQKERLRGWTDGQDMTRQIQ